MKTKKAFLITFFIAVAFISNIEFVLAEGIVPCGLGEKDPCTLCHLIIGIKKLADWGLGILITIAIVGIFIAGIMYIISSGSEGLMKQAKGFLTASLTGFTLVLMAWFIVNLTIYWIAMAKNDLGIGKTDWHTFTCDTASTAISGTGTTPTAAQTDCCINIKTSDPNNSEYGKPENCAEPTGGGPTKAECEKWCEDGGGSENYINECKSGCKDPEEKNCEKGNMVSGMCSSQPACGGTAGSPGNCAGFPTNGDDNECALVSQDLNQLLSCMKNNNTPGKITSITSEETGGNYEASKSCCGSGHTSTCPHSNSSCHHGCKLSSDKYGYSYAIDIGTSTSASDADLCAIADGTKGCNVGKIFGPRNINCPGGSKIQYWDGHKDHLHISTSSCNG